MHSHAVREPQHDAEADHGPRDQREGHQLLAVSQQHDGRAHADHRHRPDAQMNGEPRIFCVASHDDMQDA
jgi:hypothetical protein